MVFFSQLVINGLVVGSIYALAALGFVLIYKASEVLNLAQGQLVMVGAYVAFAFAVTARAPLWLAIPLALLVCGALALAIERLFLRPLIGKPIIAIIMVTIGLSSVLKGGAQIIWGVDTRLFPPLFSSAPVQLGPVPVAPVYLWSLALAVVLVAAFSIFFKYSRPGIAMRAVGEDQQAALSLGISVRWVFAVAWVIAAVIAALGGIMLGQINGINPSLALIGLRVLPVVILGGLDSVGGAIVGGLTIGVLENLSAGYLDPLVGGGVKEVAPFAVLVLILMVRPQGLFGKEVIERV